MRKFLLIVGIVLILLGLVATLQTFWLMSGVQTFSPRGRTRAGSLSYRIYPAPLGNAAFCGVLYAAGFTAFYFRRRVFS